MASSRPVVAGESYTPDDINNLRKDVLDPTGGHKHNGVDGARLPFANLDVTNAAGSTAPSGGSKSYNDIANHVASEHGAHGLASGVYVAGSATPDTMLQWGVVASGSGIVSFPAPYSSTPVVTITGLGAQGGIGEYLGYTIVSIDAAGFTYQKAADSPLQIMWIAIGTRS